MGQIIKELPPLLSSLPPPLLSFESKNGGRRQEDAGAAFDVRPASRYFRFTIFDLQFYLPAAFLSSTEDKGGGERITSREPRTTCSYIAEGRPDFRWEFALFPNRSSAFVGHSSRTAQQKEH